MLYEIVLNAEYYGQNIVNRWNYFAAGTPATQLGSALLAKGFGAIYDTEADPAGYPEDTIMWLMTAIQVQTYENVQITVNNVYDLADFYQAPFVQPYNGRINANGDSPLLAFGLYTNRVTRAVRRGQKRLAGVPDGAQEGGGGTITGGYPAALASLCAAMSAPIVVDDEGNTVTFTPAVCGKLKYAVPGSSPVRYAYKYYNTLAEQEENSAQGIVWQYKPQIRSQTSRQYGRGS